MPTARYTPSDQTWQIPAADPRVAGPRAGALAVILAVGDDTDAVLACLDRVAGTADVVLAATAALDADRIAADGRSRATLVAEGADDRSALLRLGLAWALDQGYGGAVAVADAAGIAAAAEVLVALRAGADCVTAQGPRRGWLRGAVLGLAGGRRLRDPTVAVTGYSARYLRDPDVAPFRSGLRGSRLGLYLALRAGQLGYACRAVSVAAGPAVPAADLVRCLLGGGMPPGARLGATPGLARAGLWLLAAALLVVLATRLLPFRDVHDAWLDEAMLVANLPLADWGGLFRPLPLFEQVVPLGYLALANLVASAFPEHVVPALRALSALASLIGVGFVVVTARRFSAGVLAAAAVIFTGLGALSVAYSLYIKHYHFELVVAAALLYAAVRLGERVGGRQLAGFVSAGLACLLFSTSAAVLLVAAVAGVVVQRAVHFERPSGWPGILAVAAVLALAFAAYQYWYWMPMSLYQDAAYAREGRGFAAFPPATAADWAVWRLLPAFIEQGSRVLPGSLYDGPVAPFAKAAFHALMLLGLAWFATRQVLVTTALAASVASIYALNAAQLLPLVYVRHFLFLVPLGGLAFAAGLVLALGWAARRLAPRQAPALVAGILALLLAGVAALDLQRAATLRREEISPLLAHVMAQPERMALWASYGVQPTLHLLRPPGLELVGMLTYRSSMHGWAAGQRVISGPTPQTWIDQFTADMAGRDRIWLLFGHVRANDKRALLALADGFFTGCRLEMESAGAELYRCGP